MFSVWILILRMKILPELLIRILLLSPWTQVNFAHWGKSHWQTLTVFRVLRQLFRGKLLITHTSLLRQTWRFQLHTCQVSWLREEGLRILHPVSTLRRLKSPDLKGAKSRGFRRRLRISQGLRAISLKSGKIICFYSNYYGLVQASIIRYLFAQNYHRRRFWQLSQTIILLIKEKQIKALSTLSNSMMKICNNFGV